MRVLIFLLLIFPVFAVAGSLDCESKNMIPAVYFKAKYSLISEDEKGGAKSNSSHEAYYIDNGDYKQSSRGNIYYYLPGSGMSRDIKISWDGWGVGEKFISKDFISNDCEIHDRVKPKVSPVPIFVNADIGEIYNISGFDCAMSLENLDPGIIRRCHVEIYGWPYMIYSEYTHTDGTSYTKEVYEPIVLEETCIDPDAFLPEDIGDCEHAAASYDLGDMDISPRDVGEPECQAGNPIDIATGNKYQQAIDLESSGSDPLVLSRHYNSALGLWIFNYRQRLISLDDDTQIAVRPDGEILGYSREGGSGDRMMMSITS